MNLNEDFSYCAFCDKCPYSNEDEVVINLKKWFCVNPVNDKKCYGFKNVGTHDIDYFGINGAKQRLKYITVMKELVKRVQYFENGEMVKCEEKYKDITAWDIYLKHADEFKLK